MDKPSEVAEDVRDVQELGKLAAKVLGHAKFLSLSPAAGWLWMRGLTYLTAGNGTLGGFITDAAFKQIGGTSAKATELIGAGLWRRDTNGWRMKRLNAAVPPVVSRTVAAPQPVGTELMRFETIGEPEFWVLTKEQVESWQQTYRQIDVLAECGYAKAWTEGNGYKTHRGMHKFLVRWLSTATDRGRRGSSGGQRPKAGLTGPAPAGKYDHLTKSDDV